MLQMNVNEMRQIRPDLDALHTFLDVTGRERKLDQAYMAAMAPMSDPAAAATAFQNLATQLAEAAAAATRLAAFYSDKGR